MHNQVRAMIASTLKGAVSQRLVPTIDGSGRVACCEVLRMTGRVRDMITDPAQTGKLPEVIAEGSFYGMQTFDQHLFEHLKAGRVEMDTAIQFATSPHDFKLLVAADGKRGTTMDDLSRRSEPAHAGRLARAPLDGAGPPDKVADMQTTLAQFNETASTDAFALQNSYLLKVRLDQGAIRAKQGSMVAYQGDVTFEHAGTGGMSKFMKKALTGEGQDLMKVSGTGEVFLADTAQHVHLIMLEGASRSRSTGATCSPSTRTSTGTSRRCWGASGVMGGGLFNTTLRGAGWVAILSDGNPVLLDVGSAPTFADAQAAITWSQGVTTSIKTDFKLSKTLTGRSSGESVQMAFGGQGWVLVQPSEGRVGTQPASGGGGLGNLLGG